METLITFLPFVLLVLICPLMMLFMHRGGHGGDQHDHVAGHEQIARGPNTVKDEVRP